MAVATGCPCDVRLNRRRPILDRAFGAAPAPIPPTTPPAAPPTPGGDMFIRNKNVVYQLIFDGARSYWRSIPANAASSVPAAWIIDDASGAWLGLWQVGAPK